MQTNTDVVTQNVHTELPDTQKTELEYFIHICNNIFYNNYLETGRLNTKSEIEQRIKKDVCESLLDFYDKEDHAKILQRMNHTKINFVYQMFGSLCSVDKFLEHLEGERAQHFPERNDSVTLRFLLDYFNNIDLQKTPIEKIVDDNLKLFAECYEILLKNIDKTDLRAKNLMSYDMKSLFSNQMLFKQFLDLLKEYIQLLESRELTLHDNPQINENLKFVRNFVEKVKIDIKQKCKQYNLNFVDITNYDTYGIGIDPVVTNLYPECFTQKDNIEENTFSKKTLEQMLRISQKGFICGYYDQDTVFLPSSLVDEENTNEYKGLTDDTVIHEFGHAVTQGGFVKDDPLVASDDKYDVLEEVVNDWLAFLIDEERRVQNKPAIISYNKTKSTYSVLFPVMKDFLNTYLPELKKIRLSENPVEGFIRILGKDNFDQLATLCDTYLKQNANLKICNEGDKMCLPVGEIIKDLNEKFQYNGTISDSLHLKQIVNDELDKTAIDLYRLSQKVANIKKSQTFEQVQPLQKYHHFEDCDSSNLKNNQFKVESQRELVPTGMEI